MGTETTGGWTASGAESDELMERPMRKLCTVCCRCCMTHTVTNPLGDELLVRMAKRAKGMVGGKEKCFSVAERNVLSALHNKFSHLFLWCQFKNQRLVGPAHPFTHGEALTFSSKSGSAVIELPRGLSDWLTEGIPNCRRLVPRRSPTSTSQAAIRRHRRQGALAGRMGWERRRRADGPHRVRSQTS